MSLSLSILVSVSLLGRLSCQVQSLAPGHYTAETMWREPREIVMLQLLEASGGATNPRNVKMRTIQSCSLKLFGVACSPTRTNWYSGGREIGLEEQEPQGCTLGPHGPRPWADTHIGALGPRGWEASQPGLSPPPRPFIHSNPLVSSGVSSGGDPAAPRSHF